MPEIPESYWVDCLTYRCKDCGHTFDAVVPNGDDIVKFKEIDGKEEKWLPTYGKGGYLDLLNKLLPDISSKDEITQEIASAFLSELNKHCEKNPFSNDFCFDYFTSICKSCCSKNTEYAREKRYSNPELPWLKISCKLME